MPAIALLLPGAVTATPQFAREFAVDCSACHVAPPRLNQRGEDFVARGYRFAPEERPMPSHRTVPLAVWNTVDLEYRRSTDLVKLYPSRVEIIAAGRLGRRAAYFVELRAVSQQVGSGGGLLNRSGRFEDLFVDVPANRSGSLSVTVGQFRALAQVDVSRRLSISEPTAFAAGLPARQAASRPRLTALRSFSPAGRQPGVRLMYQRPGGTRAADGWYSSLTVPLTGELTLPFTEAASFELELRPKGMFAETFYRAGMTSVGGHVFAGEGRSLTTAVFSSDLTRRWAVLAATGVEALAGVANGRVSLGSEYLATETIVLGTRLDHRTGAGRRPALAIYLNGHMPFGPAALRQALRLQIEQTLQRNGVRTAIGLSHVF